ncbi:MAG: S8 family serine peptidase, partial [Lachnospiraceae bacterium]|nr:S8 family serine peptidase [Lachnospiraceae bacterium]
EIPGDEKDNDGNGFIDDVNGWDFYNGDATVCHYATDPETGEVACDPTDSDNHGTHVAGIIAAIPDNGIGVYGAASPFVNVKIMVLKCLGGGSNLTPGKGSMYDTIKAIEYATAMGADICNLSWGNTIYSSGLYEAIKDSDMLFVTAAGNTSDNNDVIPMYPASYDLPNVISVASTGLKSEISEFSNYGPNSVDVAAPGERIISTTVGSYDTMSGTSMSAPFVSGVAAILYASSAYTYPESVKDTIIASVRKTPALTGYIKTPGIVDASVAASMSEFLADDFEAPSLKSDVKINKDITLTVKYEDNGTSGLRVAKYLYGHKSLNAFHRGTVGLPLKDGANILSKKGTYTVYLSDFAGNDEIFEIDAKEHPVTELSTTYSRKMLRKGGRYKIKYHIAPKVNTETVSFSSSSKKIAVVNKEGVITAKKKGSCTITVKTSGGMKAKFKLYVK